MAPVTRELVLTALKPVVRRIFFCWTLELMFGFIHIGLAVPTYYRINYDVRFLIIFVVTGALTALLSVLFIWKLKNHRDQQSLHDMSWLSYFLPSLTASMAGVSALLTVFIMINSTTQLSTILFIILSASFLVNVLLNLAGLCWLAKIYVKLNPKRGKTQTAIEPARTDEDIELLAQNQHLNRIVEYGTQQCFEDGNAVGNRENSIQPFRTDNGRLQAVVNITRETTNIIHHHHQYEGNNGVPNTHNHQPDEGSSATPTTRHLQQSVGSNSVPSHHQRNERNDSEPSQHQRNERNDALPSPPRSRNTLPAIAASAPQFPSEDNDYQENYFIESQQPRPDMQSRPVQRSVLPSITQYAHSSDGYHPSNVDHSINNAGLPSYSDIISSQQKQ